MPDLTRDARVQTKTMLSAAHANLLRHLLGDLRNDGYAADEAMRLVVAYVNERPASTRPVLPNTRSSAAVAEHFVDGVVAV